MILCVTCLPDFYHSQPRDGATQGHEKDGTSEEVNNSAKERNISN